MIGADRIQNDALYHISQMILLHSQTQEVVAHGERHRHLRGLQPHRDDKLKAEKVLDSSCVC